MVSGKKLLRATTVVLSAMIAVTGCTKVTQKDYGLKVSLMGDDKGGIEIIKPGRYILWPNTDYVLYPRSIKTVVWTRSETEGSKSNEEISFNSSDGLPFTADFGASIQVDGAKVKSLYRTYRKDLDEIANIYVRNVVRDTIQEEAAKLDAASILGAGKTTLMITVNKTVISDMKTKGILIDKVFLIGKMRPPKKVEDSIQNKLSAIQDAEAINTRATAAKEAAITKAQGEAQALKLVSNELNKNPQLVLFKIVEKWDGVAPKFLGGDLPLPTLDAEK